MLTDLEEVLTQIKTLAKSARGWITEKRIEKEDGIFIEISVTFKRDLNYPLPIRDCKGIYKSSS
jgi:hypothetical protein